MARALAWSKFTTAAHRSEDQGRVASANSWRITAMLKKILGYFTLPLLVLFGLSWQISEAQPPEKNTEGQTVTRSRMLVVNGNVTMDLDLNRLKGISAAQESKRESVRFEVGPNSFFTILAFNDALRGPQPGSMGLIGGNSAVLPEAVKRLLKPTHHRKAPVGCTFRPGSPRRENGLRLFQH